MFYSIVLATGQCVYVYACAHGVCTLVIVFNSYMPKCTTINSQCIKITDGVLRQNDPHWQCLSKKDDILIQQLTELWTNYGDLVELWYDGGYDLGPEMVRRWTFPRDRFIF